MCLLATHQLLPKLGLTVFNFFILGGISWDIWSENVFAGDAQTDTQLGNNCIQTFYMGRYMYIMGYIVGECV